MTQAYDKLKELLEELFQFDREDLDFGIYRIMNQKRVEVSKFLEHNLLRNMSKGRGVGFFEAGNFYPDFILWSFIISNTSYAEVLPWKLSKEELEDRHVLFQSEDGSSYVEDMLRRILSEKTPAGSAW